MWRRLGYWLALAAYVAGAGVLFVIAAYLSFSLFVRRGVTPVPEVGGLSLEDAQQHLVDSGLRLEHHPEEDRYAEGVEPGLVVEQRPAAGSLAKRGGVVEVFLSRGRRLVEVPDLTGDPVPTAQVTLSAVGLEQGPTIEVFVGRGTSGMVVDQHPPPSSEVERGTRVALFVARQNTAETYVMPDFFNRDYRLVRFFLERNGFRVGGIKYEAYEGVSRSVVLRQFPLPGHPLRRDDVISLVVAAVPGSREVDEPGEAREIGEMPEDGGGRLASG